MPTISARTLGMVIQAVDAEVRRLHSLPEEQTVPGDHILLDDYENVAEELEEAYEEACKTIINVPPYSKLVDRPD